MEPQAPKKHSQPHLFINHPCMVVVIVGIVVVIVIVITFKVMTNTNSIYCMKKIVNKLFRPSFSNQRGW